MYYAKGVDLGSKYCCYVMASAFETGDGTLGLDVDEAEARRYYTMMFTRCSVDDLVNADSWEHAKQWLRDNGADETIAVMKESARVGYAHHAHGALLGLLSSRRDTRLEWDGSRCHVSGLRKLRVGVHLQENYRRPGAPVRHRASEYSVQYCILHATYNY